MIRIKSKKEIEKMKEGGKILARILEILKNKAKPEITTKELDREAENLILKFKAKPAFKNYQGFPATLCTSVNQVVVHGVPSDYKLKAGDILSLDLGIKYKDFFVDMALTIPIGDSFLNHFNPEVMRMIKITKKALKLGIKKARVGKTVGDIGNTIQRYVESQGFNVVRELFGHGIGKQLHEEPKIPNYGKRHQGEEIKEGMVFCIEPMVTMGDWKIKKSNDGFGYETKDGSLSCHFEHTIAVIEKETLILTNFFS